MEKILQGLLLVFILAIVAFIPFLFSGLLPASSSPQQVQVAAAPITLTNGVQEIRIHASPEGYSPASFTVKKGVPVKILFSADKYAGCGRQLLIPGFGVNLIADENQVVPAEFTPNQEGTFPYRCSMNMFKGLMTVTA